MWLSCVLLSAWSHTNHGDGTSSKSISQSIEAHIFQFSWQTDNFQVTETHGTIRSVHSGDAIETKTRTKSSCACWMSIAVAALALLVALILAVEPQTFRRVIYTLSNNVPRQTGYDYPSHLFIFYVCYSFISLKLLY